MTDEELWQKLRDAENRLTSALHDLIVATAAVAPEPPPGEVKIVGCSDWALVARVRGVESGGDPFGYPQVFAPIGQEEFITKSLSEQGYELTHDEVEDCVLDEEED